MMTDIHSHILPYVDDGSKSLEMTKNILRQYVFQDIGKVICTPHQNRDCTRPEVLKNVFSKLVEAVKDIPVELYLGAEIYYYPEMIRDLKDGKLLTLNGSKLVLVEFSTRQETDIADAVYELRCAGYVPVVAHVERYFYLKKEDYFAITDSGGLIQVNAGAFNDRADEKVVKYLLKNDLVDFIASDCHGDVHRNVDYTSALRYVQKKYPERLDKLFGAGFWDLAANR